jgi:DHA2 family multidrug resistance protein-like MFS transporter
MNDIDIRPNPKRWIILAACILAAMVPAIGLSMIAFIAPAIQRNFQISNSSMGLLVSIGLLIISAFILGGGTLGDIYGRKRLLLIGLVGAIFASLLSMAAVSYNLLFAAQMLAGASGALISPLSLAIILVSFDSNERPKAIGILIGTSSLIVGLSILAIQWLNQSYGWRSTFSIITLIALVALFLILKIAPESKSPSQKRVDWIGIMLCATGLIGIVFGINAANGPNGFLTGSVIVPVLLGLFIMCVFFWWESRTKHAAMPFGLFQNRVFSISMIINVLMGLVISGVTFQISNYFQVLLNLPPMRSALLMAPLPLSLFVFSILGGLFIGRLGNRNVLFLGSIISMLGIILMALIVGRSDVLLIFLASEVLLGFGLGIANTAQANVTLSIPPRELAGSSAAVNNAGQTLGNSFGIALLNSLLMIFGISAYNRILGDAGLNQTQIYNATLMLKKILADDVGYVASKYSVPVSKLEELVAGYVQAYETGLAEVLIFASAVLLICAALTWIFIPNVALSSTQLPNEGQEENDR